MGKILVYPLTENVGGVEEFELNLIRYIDENEQRKYGYIVLGNNSPYIAEIEKSQSDYYTLPTRKKLISNIIQTYRLFRRLRGEYDFLYFNTSALGYIIPYLYAILFGYKVILHSHLDGSVISTKLKKKIQYINYKLIKKKLYLKLACSIQAAKWMFCNEIEDVQIIPNAINIERFKFDPMAREKLRKQMGINNEIVIGNVSRLTEIKNQSFLIELIRDMVDRGDRVRLVLVGDGEDKDRLKNYASQLGVDEHVVFYGKTNEPELIMNVFDCVVLPSYTEGFPISIIEAQAAGLKCVISDTITESVNVTGDVKYVSLNAPKERWIDVINSLEFSRNDNAECLKELGFDVNRIESFIYETIKKCEDTI